MHFSTALYLKQHKLYLEGFINILYIEMLLEHQLNGMNWQWEIKFLIMKPWRNYNNRRKTYLLPYLPTYLVTARPYGPLRALAALIKDAHSSLWTAFHYHLFTHISRRSFSKSSNHIHLFLPFFYFPQVYSQIFS